VALHHITVRVAVPSSVKIEKIAGWRMSKENTHVTTYVPVKIELPGFVKVKAVGELSRNVSNIIEGIKGRVSVPSIVEEAKRRGEDPWRVLGSVLGLPRESAVAVYFAHKEPINEILQSLHPDMGRLFAAIDEYKRRPGQETFKEMVKEIARVRGLQEDRKSIANLAHLSLTTSEKFKILKNILDARSILLENYVKAYRSLGKDLANILGSSLLIKQFPSPRELLHQVLSLALIKQYLEEGVEPPNKFHEREVEKRKNIKGVPLRIVTRKREINYRFEHIKEVGELLEKALRPKDLKNKIELMEKILKDERHRRALLFLLSHRLVRRSRSTPITIYEFKKLSKDLSTAEREVEKLVEWLKKRVGEGAEIEAEIRMVNP